MGIPMPDFTTHRGAKILARAALFKSHAPSVTQIYQAARLSGRVGRPELQSGPTLDSLQLTVLPPFPPGVCTQPRV